MSIIKSSAEHLTLNADGVGKDIKFQANGVDVASINSAGFVGDGSALTGNVGKVLQVVQGVSGTVTSFTGTSGACGASVTITPKLASSKVLVIVNIDGITFGAAIGYGKFLLKRGTTEISFFGYPRNWTSVDNASGTTMSTTYLDSPTSTAALTYGTDWSAVSGAPTLVINRDGAAFSKSTITVMEIAQ
jgi:hypothetical protein